MKETLMDKLVKKYGNLDGMKGKNCAKHGYMYTYNGKCILCIEEETRMYNK